MNESHPPRRRLLTFALLALAALALGSCARVPAASRWAPGPAGTPVRGGRILLLREEDPDYLDPALSYGVYSEPVIAAVFHTLLDYADAPGAAGSRLVPDLAESLPDVREGGRLLAFKVRADARFGPPLHRHITAADFKYSIERLFRVNSPGMTFYGMIEGADRVLAGKDTTLSGLVARGDSLYVRLTGPSAVALQILSMNFCAPVPREVAERWPDGYSQHSVASGPYTVAEFVPRRRVLLVRNPDWTGRPAWLDTIDLKLSISPVNAVALIRRGLADGGFFEVPAAEYARLAGDSLWKRQIDLADPLGTWYVFMNVRVKPFDDRRVRQAVAWALDRPAICKVWSGKATPAGEFLPLAMPGAVRLGRYAGPDVARAKRLLAEAGYPHGFDTRLYGFTMEPNARVAAVIQQNLAEVGIRATLELSEAASHVAFIQDTSNHVGIGDFGWYADYPDASNFFDTLLNGRRIAAVHNNNMSLYDVPAVNDLIARAMLTPDDSTRFRMWADVDRRVMEDAPVAPYVHPLDSRLYGLRVGGWYRHVTRILRLDALYLKAPTAPLAEAAR